MEHHREPQGSPRGPRKHPKVKEKEQSVSSQLSVLPQHSVTKPVCHSYNWSSRGYRAGLLPL